MQTFSFHHEAHWSLAKGWFANQAPFGRLGVSGELTGIMIWMLRDASRFMPGEVVG
jgi:hypothetical protein